MRSYTIGLRYQAQQDCPHMRIHEAIMALVDTEMTAGRGHGKISTDQAAREILQNLKSGRPEIWVAKARLLPLLGRLSPAIPARILR